MQWLFLKKCRLGLLAAAIFGASLLQGGSGTVHTSGAQQGQIDFTVKFFFPPDAATLNQFKQTVIAASHQICDATDGQMRFGTVTITGGDSVNQDLADVWVVPQSGRAHANLCYTETGDPCYALEVPGAKTVIYSDDIGDVETFAHEMGHLALDLSDEYDEQDYGGCWGAGSCIECGDVDASNNCLMQGRGDCGIAIAGGMELCVAANHDSLLGDPNFTGDPGTDPETIDCTDPDSLNCNNAPCEAFCMNFNPTTCHYELTMQNAYSLLKFGEFLDCWSHVSQIHTFLNPPAGLPVVAMPNCAEPTFVDDLDPANQVVLVMDRSWSMRLQPGQGPCVGAGCPELCSNCLDDDGDGDTDEGSCLESRLGYLKDTARAFLNLVKVPGGPAWPATMDAGLLQFACSNQELTTGLLPVTNNNYTTMFLPAIDGLKPNGNTAIGDALLAAADMFPGGGGANPNRAIFLITDGFNNCGATVPADAAQTLMDQGIRVFLITTEAGNDAVLGEIAHQTNGYAMFTENARGLLPAMAQQWATYQNAGLLVPKLQYRLAGNGPSEPSGNARTASSWFRNQMVPQGDHPQTSPQLKSNYFKLLVEEGTTRLTLQFAGNMTDMAHFGVRARIKGAFGPNPRIYDSHGAASPLMDVTEGSLYTTVRIKDPNPGTWFVNLSALNPAGPGHLQTGFFTAITENPRANLFSSLDRTRTMQHGTQPIHLTAFPRFDTDLRNLSISCRVYRPDGSYFNVPVHDATDFNAGFSAQIKDFSQAGIHEVRLMVTTTSGVTTNHPGEPFDDSNPNTTVVPNLVRTASHFFNVTPRQTIRPGRL